MGVTAVTWTALFLGAGSPDILSAETRRSIQDGITEFLNQWLADNPKPKEGK
jgi:hypothetical protein